MAEVLLGRQRGPGFSRLVAIKRIHAHLASNDSFVRMLSDEVRIASRIQHPNVVQTYDVVIDSGVPCIVMEYLEGKNLSDIMTRLNATGHHLDPLLAAHIVAEAARGLHAAHELTDEDGSRLSIVHRDVSPQNILVTYEGLIKVLDFGVASAANRLTHSTTGEIKGKLRYMSPEQVQAFPVDRRTDVWALGAVLHELSTGRRLFMRGDPIATIRAIVEEPLVGPSAEVEEYPNDLDAVCLRALARPLEHRFESAAEMRDALLMSIRRHGGERLLERELASLMNTAFGPDRYAERSPAIPPSVTVGETTAPLESHSRARSPSMARRPRALVLRALVLRVLAASALLAAVSSTMWWLWTSGTGTSPPMVAAPEEHRDVDDPTGGVPEVAAPASTAHVTARSLPSEAGFDGEDIGYVESDVGGSDDDSEFVTVSFRSSPPCDSASVNGRVLGPCPTQWRARRSSQPMRVRYERVGYEPAEREFRADGARVVRTRLVPAITVWDAP